MYPVLFSIGRFKLFSFAFFYNVVIVVCAIVMSLEMERQKWRVPPVPKFLRWVPKSWHGTYFLDALYMGVVLMVVGLGGAHVLFGVSTTLIQGWGLGLSFYGWMFMLAANLNGSMWFGGFLACLFAVRYFARTHEKSYLEYLDAAILCPVAGQVPGRIACFLGGCCYGMPTNLPWGIALDSKYSLMEYAAGTKLHPSQLYEALLALIIFIYMWHNRTNKKYTGQNLVRYFVLTGIARFFTEMVRADTPRGVILPWLSVSQIVGVSLAIIGLVIHFQMIRRTRQLAH